MDADDAQTCLTSIRGIGDKTAAALAALGIDDAAGLLDRRSDPDALRLALNNAGIRGLTRERLDAWFDDAESLSAETENLPAAPMDSKSALPGASRHGEFTIFFDTTASGDNAGWRCRVYHAESGDEEELEGLDTWLTWVAGKLQVAVTELIPFSTHHERAAESSHDVRARTIPSRLQVTEVAVAPAGDGHLTFEVTVLVVDDIEWPREPVTAHVDLVCLNDAGKVALAESWDEAIRTSPHVARRITTGLGVGAYDVRATVTLAVDDESAERALVLELVP